MFVLSYTKVYLQQNAPPSVIASQSQALIHTFSIRVPDCTYSNPLMVTQGSCKCTPLCVVVHDIDFYLET